MPDPANPNRALAIAVLHLHARNATGTPPVADVLVHVDAEPTLPTNRSSGDLYILKANHPNYHAILALLLTALSFRMQQGGGATLVQTPMHIYCPLGSTIEGQPSPVIDNVEVHVAGN